MKIHFLRITVLASFMLAIVTLGHSQNIPITLDQGWNWIGYPCLEPMSISAGLGDFVPMNGDKVKSRNQSATYMNGRWGGSLTEFQPGKGYHYYSSRTETVSFVFGGAANDPSALPEEALDGEFTVDANGTKVRFSPGNLQCRIDPNKESQDIVGTGTETSWQMPYNTYYNYSLCQMLYTADELHAAGLSQGDITSLAFESYSTNHYVRDLYVYIISTTAEAVSTTSFSNDSWEGGAYSYFTQQDGWTQIDLEYPYAWDGVSNVLVTVEMDGDYETKTYWQCSDAGFVCSGYACNDNVGNYYSEGYTYTLTTTTLRPNTRFNGKGEATWRFAEKQWDVIGAGNANISESYTGWIDLFGWGTSGHTHGATCWLPWSTSTTSSDYLAYGNASYNLNDQTGEADWGCNPISNGGNKPNQWRTLTSNEWYYMINTRSTTSGKRYAKATVNGVSGLILLPDNWSTSYYSLSNTNNATADFTSNTISASQWQTLEQHGAVFLPDAGWRSGTSFNSGICNYWSVSRFSDSQAYDFFCSASNVSMGYTARFTGRSVRLVCQSNPRIRTIGMSGVTTTSATANAEVDCTGSATVGARGICWNTTGNPLVSDSHMASGTGTGSYTAQLTGLQPNTTYHVRAYAKIGNVYRYGNTLTFTTADDSWNGHAYVDLGLPSGLLWATCNVGADNPEDYGDYFAWGETQPKEYYDWSTYQYCNGSNTTLTKYCNDAEYGNNGFVDNQTTLFPEDDAATANWVEGWRMPTKAEFEELYNNTTWTWTTQNGVNGLLFTATNGNSLFLPAAGYRNSSSLYYAGSDGGYWSSSLGTDFPRNAWSFRFYSGGYNVGSSYRNYGRSVRPVCSSRQD